MQNNKKFIAFGAWIAILVILVSITNYLSVHPPAAIDPPPKLPPPPTMDAAKWQQVMSKAIPEPRGSATAQYTIVEFGDFCCPQCGAMHNQIEHLTDDAPVNLYFVNRPFPNLKDHTYAVQAAEAGLAAAAQGKFWPMFEQLYGHQDDLEPGFYEDYANAAGLNGAQLRKDVESHKYLQQVQDSLKFCDTMGFTMTPTLALRDNKSGKILVAAGRDNINNMLRFAPWHPAMTPTTAPAAAGPAAAPQGSTGGGTPAVAKG